MANRFEQVDEVVGDAVTIILAQRSDGQWAKVVCPKSAHEFSDRRPGDRGDTAEGRAVRRRETRQ